MLNRVVRRVLLIVSFFAIGGLVLAGCTRETPPLATSSLATKILTLADHSFTVELATTPTERAVGLMHRTTLAADHGMLFIFETPQPVTFWMKDTLLPLDILYFDEQQALTQTYTDTPPCKRDPCATYPSDAADVTYALELPAGTTRMIGAKLGDVFSLPAR